MPIDEIEIMIGSDPEFVIMCGDSVENALEIFQKVFDYEHCCKCPHPTQEDVNDIYLYGDTKEYIKDDIEEVGVEPFSKMYPGIFVSAFLITYNYNFDEVLTYLQITKEELEKTLEEPVLLHEEGISFEEVFEGTFDEQKKFVKEAILRATLIEKAISEDYKFFKLVPSDKLKFFEPHFIVLLFEYYNEEGYPRLIELPDIARRYIVNKVIEEYEAECPSCEVASEFYCTSELGCDGQAALGEMRPQPADSPIDHFNEILALMEQLEDILAPDIVCYKEDLQVRAGGIQQGYSLGGHVHIGYFGILNYGYKNFPGKHISFSNSIAKVLSQTLSLYVGIPFTLIEDKKDRERHFSGEYGEFGGYNTTEYGTEFRMLSSWLVSPQITIGALSLCYVVADDILNKVMQHIDSELDIYKKAYDSDMTYHDIAKRLLYKSTNFESHLIQIHFYKLIKHKLHEGKSFEDLRPSIPKIKSDIEQMRLYPKYKEYIDYIFDMIEKGETWNSDGDVLARWSKLW